MRLKKFKALFVAALTVGAAHNVQAQNNASAVLSKLSAKYDSYQTIDANFTLTNYTNANKKASSSSGTIFIDKKANKFHINLPGTYTLISDGKALYTIHHDVKEIEVTDVTEVKNDISPINIFTFYKKGFNNKLGKDFTAAGVALRTVELKPQTTNNNYAAINLTISKNTNTIKDVAIKSKGGGSQTYTISRLTPNVTKDETIFTVNKTNYKGYEFIDLR